MNYISTRGKADRASFEEVLLSGLALDGGLYVPQRFPFFATEVLEEFSAASYQKIAQICCEPFIDGMIEAAPLYQLIQRAYKDFSDPEIVPLRRLDEDLWMMELWHGPTFAFKDLAMQILAGLLDEVLHRKQSRATILCATSGDTGASAMAAFAQAHNVDLFVLYPDGRVSSIQRRQMMAYQSQHIHALAIEGDFDDCQKIVKDLFSDQIFREKVSLTAVNSINWARIMAQTVYYFVACALLRATDRNSKIHFIVPTGNFGDIYAGFVAKKMGAPIDRLVIANNQNDILTRTLATGIYRPTKVEPSRSPAMDIQLPSNFERLLFEACDRSPERLNAMLDELRDLGQISLSDNVLAYIRADFSAAAISDAQTLETIKDHYQKTGLLIDPHSAVGLTVAQNVELPEGFRVVLSTAHAAKFPEAVQAAIGRAFEPLAIEIKGEEITHRLKNDKATVADYIQAHSRILN